MAQAPNYRDLRVGSVLTRTRPKPTREQPYRLCRGDLIFERKLICTKLSSYCHWRILWRNILTLILELWPHPAPILYFDDIIPQNGYYSIVTKDFQFEKERITLTVSSLKNCADCCSAKECSLEVSESCYETIKQSWSASDEVASQPNGLSILSQRFNAC
ncbi:hypothetical protein HYC85_031934 [Camellia sinensis]|uniref:Uncharacterized protein n=1 Tax=Camellia sinensis TaxID=4442 RepID=A0A7J7FSS4_CAMSI|nr:hypothetical protein HYC85_031934 [Camellia sinensis]